MFIPNKCIISVSRVRNDEVVGPIVRNHSNIFESHPDADQLTLALFLIYESLKREKSFWWPYIQVMNESDLVSFWSEDELNLLNDFELKKEALVYREEVMSEWIEISKITALYPDKFGGITKDLFL